MFLLHFIIEQSAIRAFVSGYQIISTFPPIYLASFFSATGFFLTRLNFYLVQSCAFVFVVGVVVDLTNSRYVCYFFQPDGRKRVNRHFYRNFRDYNLFLLFVSSVAFDSPLIILIQLLPIIFYITTYMLVCAQVILRYKF